MKKDGDKEIIICECNSADHQMIFLYSEDDFEGIKIPMCYAHVHLNKKPLWQRVKYGLNYILGRQSRFGAFDEFIFNPKDSESIRALSEYLYMGLKDLNWEKFLNHIKSECEKYNVELDLQQAKHLELSNNIKCGGYFDGDIPRLACAMNHEESKTLLIHEYCHLTQWAEKIPLWDQALQSLEIVENWLAGNEIKDIEKHIRISKDLELDNEKRVVETIKKWNLDINISEYTKKANAYVIFYLYLEKSRKWSSPGNAPYTNKRIVDAMSSNFDMNYDQLDPEIEKLFREENI